LDPKPLFFLIKKSEPNRNSYLIFGEPVPELTPINSKGSSPETNSNFKVRFVTEPYEKNTYF